MKKDSTSRALPIWRTSNYRDTHISAAIPAKGAMDPAAFRLWLLHRNAAGARGVLPQRMHCNPATGGVAAAQAGIYRLQPMAPARDMRTDAFRASLRDYSGAVAALGALSAPPLPLRRGGAARAARAAGGGAADDVSAAVNAGADADPAAATANAAANGVEYAAAPGEFYFIFTIAYMTEYSTNLMKIL